MMAIAWLKMPPISCAHEPKQVPGLVHWEDADSRQISLLYEGQSEWFSRSHRRKQNRL